jgi:hypothetical protein
MGSFRRQAFFLGMLITELFVLAMPSAIFAQAPPADSTDIQRETVRRMRQRLDLNRWEGFVDLGVTREGVITGIRGRGINRGLTAADPVERAYQFFERHQDLFQIQNPRQELVVGGRDQGHIHFEQIVNGVKVYLRGYQVHFSGDSSGTHIYAIDGVYNPEARSVNTTPTIDSLEAGRIAQADPAHGANTYVCCYKLWISSTYDGAHSFASGGTHLVWQFSVGGGIYNGAEYMVDAHSGEILNVQQGWR